MFSSLFQKDIFWTTGYFLLNFAITIHTKRLYFIYSFNYPWILTGIHSICSFVAAAWSLKYVARSKSQHFNAHQTWMLFLFSLLYTINIVISNASMRMVSLPLHQLIRSLGPLLVMMYEWTFLNQRRSGHEYLAVFMISLGVTLASLGDYQSTALGILLTLLSVFLATTKGIMANNFTNKGSINVHPLQLLSHMTLLSFVYCSVYAFWMGETHILLERMQPPTSDQVTPKGSTLALVTELMLNGLIASLLNIVSFICSQRISPLSMSLSSNLKQILVIVSSTLLFRYKIEFLNGIGIVLACMGGYWYSWSCNNGKEKGQKKKKSKQQ